MRSIGYNSWFAPGGRRFVKRDAVRRQRRGARVQLRKLGDDDLSDAYLEWSDEQCQGCWWCHPRTLSDFIKFNEWRASNGKPPVDVPDDVDEEVVTAWNDLSPVQYRLLSARDWRGLKEPSGSRDSSASETAGPGV